MVAVQGFPYFLCSSCWGSGSTDWGFFDLDCTQQSFRDMRAKMQVQWELSGSLQWSAAFCRHSSSLWELWGNNSYWSSLFFFPPVWLKSLLQSIIPAWKITRKFSFHQIKIKFCSSLHENCCLKLQSIVLFPSAGTAFNFCFIPFMFAFPAFFFRSNMKRGKIRLRQGKKMERGRRGGE